MLPRVGLLSVCTSVERRRHLRAVCFGHLHPDLHDIVCARLQGQGGAMNIRYDFGSQARLHLFSYGNKNKINKHNTSARHAALRTRAADLDLRRFRHMSSFAY